MNRFLDLGSFVLSISSRWDVYFSPELSHEIRLTKGNAVGILEYYSLGGEDQLTTLDMYFEIESIRLKELINGAFIYDENEDIYEISVEIDENFTKYFIGSSKDFVFRLTLINSWLPIDEEELFDCLKSITSKDVALPVLKYLEANLL